MLTSARRGAIRGQGTKDEASTTEVRRQNWVTKASGASNPGRPGEDGEASHQGRLEQSAPMSKGWKTSLVNSGNRRVELLQALVESSAAVLCQ